MTKLEPEDGRGWDRYSKRWGDLDEQGLGTEWGTEALTLRIFENCLRPHLTPENQVLEIGPGGGKYGVLVAPLCARLVCADVSSQMLKRVKETLSHQNNVETLKLGGIDLSGIADESIDLAFSIDVFLHLDLEDVYGYVREFQRVLRPGGTVVIHFASFLSRPGWGQFHRIADFNRGQRRQVGRINFITQEIVTKILEEVRYEQVEVETKSTTPRDFIVTARKPFLPPDPEGQARQERILSRTKADSVAVDFLHRLAHGVEAPGDSVSIALKEYELEGDRRQVLYERPPSRIGFALTIPRNAALCGGVALHPYAKKGGSGNGVTFHIQVLDSLGIGTLFSKTLDPDGRQSDTGWHDFRIDLGPYAGKVVFLVFETKLIHRDHVPNGACWGEPAIVVDQKPTREMSHAGTADAHEKDATDYFQFHDPLADLVTERNALRGHAATIEKERDSLLGHVTNIEEELRAFRSHAAQLEQDLMKIRSNRFYRALCWVRDRFVRPRS